MSINELSIFGEIAKETDFSPELVAAVIHKYQEAKVHKPVGFAAFRMFEWLAEETNLKTWQAATIISKYTFKHPDLNRKLQREIAAGFEDAERWGV